MKKNLILLLFLLVTLSTFSQEKEKLIIGIAYDGFTKDTESIANLIKVEVTNLLGNNYDIQFPENKQLTTNSIKKEELSKQMDILLEDKSVDIVIAGGLISSQVALSKVNVSKPLFAPFALSEAKVSKNINYITSNLKLKEKIESLKEIKNFKKMTVLVDEDTINLLPQIKDKENMDIINVRKVSLNEIYDKIKNTEAVIFTPIISLTNNEISDLANWANRNKIPSFDLINLGNNNLDVLAGYNFEKELKKRVRATAINISSYFKGNLIENLPTSIETSEANLFINMKVVEETGIWPNWELLSESKLINFISNDNSDLKISLKELINIALKNNPKIIGLKKELESSDLNIVKAKSNYKPDIDLEATGLIIDKDRAESILTPAEKTLTAGVTLTQLIFSEDANMNIDIQKKQKKLKEEELKKAELDLILETAEAYMSVLKVQNFAIIQKNNLELIKQDMELAKERNSAGVSGKADIYRLESEFSKNVSSLIEIMLNIDIAKVNLKRIINYNINQKIEIENIDLSDKDFLTSNNELSKYIFDKNKINDFINYLLDETLKNSPELKSIDYGINIQERLVENAKNKKLMPTVALQGNYTINNIICEGAGSKVPDFSSIGNISDTNTKTAFGDVLSAFGNPDEFNWNIGVSVKLPIYSGGEIEADKKIAQNSIEALGYQKESAVKYLEQQITASMYQVISEYSQIKSAEISLNSAKKALDIVKDSYSNGVATVSDLISAQTSVLSAEQYSSTITYDLLTAVMRAERITGNYYILKSDKEKIEFNKEMTLGGIIK